MYFTLLRVQVNVFLSRLNGEPIGFSVLGIFVIDKNTILTVCLESILIALKKFVFPCGIARQMINGVYN